MTSPVIMSEWYTSDLVPVQGYRQGEVIVYVGFTQVIHIRECTNQGTY